VASPKRSPAFAETLVTELREGLESAGFTNVEISPTHEVTDDMHSAVVRSSKPSTEAAIHETKPADACCGVNT
jgi:hypothetical protein